MTHRDRCSQPKKSQTIYLIIKAVAKAKVLILMNYTDGYPIAPIKSKVKQEVLKEMESKINTTIFT